MHSLIVSQHLGDVLVVRRGHKGAARIPSRGHSQLLRAAPDAPVPEWLAAAARSAWNLDLAGTTLDESVVVRQPTLLQYARASWEINLGCDYDCGHCYLGAKEFEGLPWEHKARLLHTIRDAGVLWFQITGGEPLIDRDFPVAYTLANELGMMVDVQTNGSHLAKPVILELFTRLRPYRLAISVYGGTAETYNAFVRNRTAFQRFVRGLDAAQEAQLPVRLSIVVTRHNAHEIDAMRNMATSRGFEFKRYTNISPTIQGTGDTLNEQALEHLTLDREPFRYCPAGHTFFHVDPFGRAGICKVSRDRQVDLMASGLEGLAGLGDIADSLQLRTGGCSGCQLSAQCVTCRPLAKLHQEAKAPLRIYCQHGQPQGS